MLEIKSCFRKCSDCYLLKNSNKTVCNFNFIGKLDLEVEDVISMETPYYYRNKGQVPVGIQNEQVVCGFYRIHSNDIIDMNECLIQHDSINKTVQTIKKLLQKSQKSITPIPFYTRK